MNIFEQLIKERICFAVVISAVQFRGSSQVGNEYSIIALECDVDDISNFEKNREFPGILEYWLSAEEIELFKENQNKFVKVQHNQDGRIYELTNNSFSKYYKQWTLQNAPAKVAR